MNESYPERIIPAQTSGGPLAAHLKRYDFARGFVDMVVLDIACGMGYGSGYLAESAKEVTGVDISKEAITYAKEYYQRDNISFKVMDAHRLEFPDGHFDVVCSFETLEHLSDPERFVFEVRRVLRENGVFVVSTPHVKKTTRTPKNPYHKIEFSQKDFFSLLNKYFKEVEILGQRRSQSVFHYYLQKMDFLHLRRFLPQFAIRKICHTVNTQAWDEVGIKDFIISREGIKRAKELIGFCKG